MPPKEIQVPYAAPIPVGHRIAIEIYENRSVLPVIVDLVTGIRWGTGIIWGRRFDARPKLSRRSEVIVRGCWVGADMGPNGNETHTKLLIEDPPPSEGPYR